MRRFVDTNVLVYADSADEPVKQQQAIRLIRSLLERGEGVLSTQVLQEFANVALRKLGLPVGLIHERLALYRRFEVVITSPDLIAEALDLTVTRSLSFYDALIVEAARCSGCVELLSEDLQTGATIAGVGIVNPFAEPQATSQPARAKARKSVAKRAAAPRERAFKQRSFDMGAPARDLTKALALADELGDEALLAKLRARA